VSSIPGWMGPMRAAVVGAGAPARPAGVDQMDAWVALGGALASLAALDARRARDELAVILAHPLLDARSATITEFALIMAGALQPILDLAEGRQRATDPVLDRRRLESTIEAAEQCGLGWVARVAHAATALADDADGPQAARLVRSACAYDGDRWGIALSALFEGLGVLLAGVPDRDPFEAAAAEFAALGGQQLATIANRLAANVSGSASASASPESPRPAPNPAVDASVPVGLRCFGSLEFVVGGRRLDLSSVRPRALSVLRVLAAYAGQAVHRETIMEALWRDSPPDAARRGLQVAISSVRQAMPVRADLRIIRRGEAYELAMASGAYFDVDVFRASISTAWDAARTGDHAAVLMAANAAIEVYRGDLLVDEGPADWVITPRENLRLDLVRAATLAAESALVLGDPRAAIRAIERGIAVDRYASGLWELLITAHEEAGDRAAAARVRHSFDEAMADLDV